MRWNVEVNEHLDRILKQRFFYIFVSVFWFPIVQENLELCASTIKSNFFFPNYCRKDFFAAFAQLSESLLHWLEFDETI